MRALAAVLLAGVCFADHELLELACPAEVTYRVYRDLDGDGLDDILIVTGRQAWLWRGRASKLPRQPDARLELPEGTAFFDVGPPGAKRQGIVARTASAYWALHPGGEPEQLPHASGPGLPPRPANVLWRGFYRDFDADGRQDFLDVSLAGYTIRFDGGASVRLPPRLKETVDTRAASASGRLIARYALSDWTHGDFDGDGKSDFAIVTDTGLLVYPGGEDGRFDPARSKEIPLEEAKDADLTFLDFNGDGRTDVVALHRKAGQASLILAGEEGGLAAPRRLRFAIPGELHYAVIADLQGDGRPDLGLPFTSRPSIQAGVRALVRGETILRVPVFLNRGGSTPVGARADAQFTFPVRLRIKTDSVGRVKISGLVVVEYRGDLDGDGRPDLLVTASSRELGLHRGVDGDVFEKEASRRIAIADCADYDAVHSGAANLNGDAAADVVLHYSGAGRRPDRLFVLLSRKK